MEGSALSASVASASTNVSESAQARLKMKNNEFFQQLMAETFSNRGDLYDKVKNFAQRNHRLPREPQEFRARPSRGEFFATGLDSRSTRTRYREEEKKPEVWLLLVNTGNALTVLPKIYSHFAGKFHASSAHRLDTPCTRPTHSTMARWLRAVSSALPS